MNEPEKRTNFIPENLHFSQKTSEQTAEFSSDKPDKMEITKKKNKNLTVTCE